MTTTEYLEEHSLRPDFVKTLGWQLEEDSIVIPYYDENAQLLFYKERLLNDPEKKFKYQLGNSPTLYASYKIKKQQVIILCEGEPDCARLWQEGIPAVTGGGVSALNTKIALPLKNKDIIVLLDNDIAGQKAVKKTCQILQEVDAFPRVASLPKEYKDVCEFFTAGNSFKDFEQIINESVDVDVWEERNKPKEFSIVSGQEILTREIPKQKWLISRMIPVEGISFLVGYEGTGKSFYALTMANAIATGNEWLKTFEVKQQANVLFLDKENTLHGIQERLAGLAIKGENLFFLEYPEFFDFEGEQNNFSPFAEHVKQFIEKNNIGFIVIDSFIDFMRGNENSSNDTQVFFSTIKQLFVNKSILVIHHAGKPTQGVTRTSSQKARGSTNIMAQAFSSFFIESIPNKANEFSIEHTKLRGAQKIKKFKVEMEIHTDLYDKEDTRVVNLRYAGEIEDEADKEILAQETIIDTLSNTPQMQRSELENLCLALSISKRTFTNVLKKLEDEKIIEKIADPLNAHRRLIRLI